MPNQNRLKVSLFFKGGAKAETIAIHSLSLPCRPLKLIPCIIPLVILLSQ